MRRKVEDNSVFIWQYHGEIAQTPVSLPLLRTHPALGKKTDTHHPEEEILTGGNALWLNIFFLIVSGMLL